VINSAKTSITQTSIILTSINKKEGQATL